MKVMRYSYNKSQFVLQCSYHISLDKYQVLYPDCADYNFAISILIRYHFCNFSILLTLLAAVIFIAIDGRGLYLLGTVFMLFEFSILFFLFLLDMKL